MTNKNNRDWNDISVFHLLCDLRFKPSTKKSKCNKKNHGNTANTKNKRHYLYVIYNLSSREHSGTWHGR